MLHRVEVCVWRRKKYCTEANTLAAVSNCAVIAFSLLSCSLLFSGRLLLLLMLLPCNAMHHHSLLMDSSVLLYNIYISLCVCTCTVHLQLLWTRTSSLEGSYCTLDTHLTCFVFPSFLHSLKKSQPSTTVGRLTPVVAFLYTVVNQGGSDSPNRVDVFKHSNNCHDYWTVSVISFFFF